MLMEIKIEGMTKLIAMQVIDCYFVSLELVNANAGKCGT